MSSTQSTRGSRNRGGFSLVEATLVLVILAILSAIAAPRYASFTANQQLEAVARRVVADLALAQRNARQSSASRTVTFDVVQQLYTLNGITDPDHPLQTYAVRLGEEPYRARLVSASFGGDAAIVYDGFGTPDSGGTLVVAVGSRKKTITFDAGGGKPTKSPTQIDVVQ